MSHLTSHHTLPPFVEGVETAPLTSVRLAVLEAEDESERSKCFDACKQLGFFYLDLNRSPLGERLVRQAEELHAFQKEWFAQPSHDKDRYGRDKVDPFYAYRYTVSGQSEGGEEFRSENYNIRKDDLLGNCERLPTHPWIVEKQPLFESYMRDCRAVMDVLFKVLEHELQLPPGTLTDLHRIDALSGDHIRLTQSAPTPYNETRAKTGEHTDFGSITILFNWLGGLQIRNPSNEAQWLYVRPVPGSCIVNLGDAMVKFTAGILRSNIHRVVPPIGPQAGLFRNSLVCFSRPENDVVLKRLKGGLIDSQPRVKESVEMTSHEWIMQRSMGQLRGIYTHGGGIETKPSAWPVLEAVKGA